MPKITKIESKPTIIKPKRVAAYARVSTGKDAMLHSLSAQVSYYNELIQNRPDWQFAGVYSDEAITGTKENRDDFQRMLCDCRAGKIDIVITKSISRFARNTVTLLNVTRELKSLGVDVFFEEQNIHTISSEGELMLTILASYAQEESLSASENMKWKVRRNFESGRPWFGDVFGYHIENGKYVIIPEEAEVVKLVFSLYLSGKGKNYITRELNRQGVPTKRNKEKWGVSTVENMLRNRIYKGDLLLQQTYHENHLTKRKCENSGEYPMVLVEKAHEGIISTSDFDAVQAEIKRRAEISNKSSGLPHPFSGLLKCEICGKSYRRKTVSSGHKWICSTYDVHGKSVCASKAIPEETLERAICTVLGIAAFDESECSKRIGP